MTLLCCVAKCVSRAHRHDSHQCLDGWLMGVASRGNILLYYGFIR